MDRICHLRVFDYVSVCATGSVRESEVYPERPQMEKNNQRTYHSHTTTTTYMCHKEAFFLVKGSFSDRTLFIIREGTGRGGDLTVCFPCPRKRFTCLLFPAISKKTKNCLKGSYNPPDRNDLEFTFILCTKHRWKRNPPQ